MRKIQQCVKENTNYNLIQKTVCSSISSFSVIQGLEHRFNVIKKRVRHKEVEVTNIEIFKNLEIPIQQTFSVCTYFSVHFCPSSCPSLPPLSSLLSLPSGLFPLPCLFRRSRRKPHNFRNN